MLRKILRKEFSMGTNGLDRNRFTQLISALSTGWEIEEPVLLGAMWRPTNADGHGTYHFVLRHRAEDKTTLLSLPPSPQLLVFLLENKINVNAVQG
jgi:hypothetical protein